MRWSWPDTSASAGPRCARRSTDSARRGWSSTSPNRGARVATWSLAEIESVFELRSTLEPRLTALAVQAATEQDVATLADLAEQMLGVGLPGPHQDLDAVVPLNRAFHEHLVRLADHTALGPTRSPPR